MLMRIYLTHANAAQLIYMSSQDGGLIHAHCTLFLERPVCLKIVFGPCLQTYRCSCSFDVVQIDLMIEDSLDEGFDIIAIPIQLPGQDHSSDQTPESPERQ